MTRESINTGDLVVLDMSNPAWEHLKKRENAHPLRLQGIVTGLDNNFCTVKFSGWTAYLKKSDVVKVS